MRPNGEASLITMFHAGWKIVIISAAPSWQLAQASSSQSPIAPKWPPNLLAQFCFRFVEALHLLTRLPLAFGHSLLATCKLASRSRGRTVGNYR